jgi:hypothetical protein
VANSRRSGNSQSRVRLEQPILPDLSQFFALLAPHRQQDGNPRPAQAILHKTIRDDRKDLNLKKMVPQGRFSKCYIPSLFPPVVRILRVVTQNQCRLTCTRNLLPAKDFRLSLLSHIHQAVAFPAGPVLRNHFTGPIDTGGSTSFLVPLPSGR